MKKGSGFDIGSGRAASGCMEDIAHRLHLTARISSMRAKFAPADGSRRMATAGNISSMRSMLARAVGSRSMASAGNISSMFILASGLRQMGLKGRVERIIERPKARRWAALFTAVFMLTAALCSFATGETAARPVTLPEEISGMPDFFACERGLVLLLNGRVYVQNGDKWDWIYENASAERIAGDEGRIVIYEKGALTEIDHAGRETARYSLPDGILVRQMALGGERVILTAETGADGLTPGEGEPFMLDLEAGKMEHVPLARAYAVCAAGGTHYILHDGEEMTWDISRVDADGTMEKICSVPAMGAQEIAATESGLYLLDLSDVAFIPFSGQDEADGDLLRHIVLEHPRCARLAAFGQTVYLYNYADTYEGTEISRAGAIVRADIGADRPQAQRRLTFYEYVDDSSERGMYMKKWWAENHPEAEMAAEKSVPQLGLRLMAGDMEYDIIEGYGEQCLKAMRAGAFLNLSEAFPELSAQMQADGYRGMEAFMMNGDLYGVPVSINFSALHFNADIAQHTLALTLPEEGMSWSELIGWGIENLSGTGYYLFEDIKAVDLFWRQYIAWSAEEKGCVDLNTPEFCATMQAFADAYEAGLIARYEDRERAVVSVGSFRAGGKCFAIPTMEGTRADYARVDGYFVNINSEDTDLAGAYLAEFTSAKCQAKACESVLEDHMLPGICYAEDEFFGMSEILTESLSAAKQRHPEMFAHMAANADAELIGCMRADAWRMSEEPAPDGMYYDILNEDGLAAAYFGGRIDLEEYIAGMQPMLDLRQYE